MLPAFPDLWETLTPDSPSLSSAPIAPNYLPTLTALWHYLRYIHGHTLHFLGSASCHHLQLS